MKLKNLKPPGFPMCGYFLAATLGLFLLSGIGPANTAAQRVQKRITSVWTATGAAGSRVTVASDASLSDYEAYTRGDRFYVRVPLADLPSTTGSLLGRGFDDVQIQRVGDGILLSFRLQPGTAARVEQKLNRLEVVFTVPVRFQNTSSDRNEANNRTRARTVGDTAGPRPPMSPSESPTRATAGGRHAERAARATGTEGQRRSAGSAAQARVMPKSSAGESRKPNSPREKAFAASSPRSTTGATPAGTSSKPAEVNGATARGPQPPTPTVAASPTPASSPTHSPTPGGSPSPAASPAASVSPFAGTASPSATAAPAGPVSVASPTPIAVSASRTDWSSRLHYYKEFVRLNPIPFAIAAGLFVVLLLVLFVRGGRKQRRGNGAYRKEKSTSDGAGDTVKPVSVEPAGAASNRSSVSPKNSSSSPVPNHPGEEPDREVFEL